MAITKKSILTKFYFVATFMSLFLFAIIFRVFNIQYTQGEKYRKLSADLTVRKIVVEANKGNVYAADGNLLATSMSRFDIYMDVMTVKKEDFDKNVVGLSNSLSKMFGFSSNYYQQKLLNARNRKSRYLSIAKKVGYNNYLEMRKFPIFNLGVYKGGFIAEQETVRAHPIGKIAERTIGYDDARGEAGIEGAYADFMEGKNGLRWQQRIAKGRWKPINDVNEKEPIDGHDVITTIDVNMQDITHHALLKQLEFYQADHGCAIVMEVATGEIKAISNLARTSDGKYFEKRNYAVWEIQEPGSTFKVASLLAALDDKKIDTSTIVDTEKGRIFIHGSKVEDSEHGGHGKISAARVIEVSSNVGIVKLIQEHYDNNPEQFLKKIESYGFTKKIDLPIKGEGIPVVPTPKDKRWNSISLEWMSWGYGIAVTPLQTLTFYNAIANDGVMVKPRFIKELRKHNKTVKVFGTEITNPKIASKEAIDKVKKVLENVVVKGTASKIYSPNFSMAGKTGTAKKSINGSYSSKLYVGSFAGFFPVDNPKYSCFVMIDEPKSEIGFYGAMVAGPVFKEIAQKIYTTTPINNQFVDDKVHFAKIDDDFNNYPIELAKEHSKIPDVKGMSGMDALSLLENIGLKVKISGMGKVRNQSIEKGEKLVKGQTIILNLS